MIVFIVFSGVWYKSTYDNMRGFTNGVYSKTDDWQGVNEQYEDMVVAFNYNMTPFTYHIAGIDIPVNMVEGASKDYYIDKVLDGYTSALYNRGDLKGVQGAIHSVAGKATHDVYTILSVISGLIVLIILVFMFRKAPLVDFLKQAGISFVLAGIISLIMLFLVYALLVSTWTDTNTAIYKEGLPIIASMIKDTYILYMAVVIVFGIILMLPAVFKMLTKGKSDEKPKEKPTEKPAEKPGEK